MASVLFSILSKNIKRFYVCTKILQFFLFETLRPRSSWLCTCTSLSLSSQRVWLAEDFFRPAGAFSPPELLKRTAFELWKTIRWSVWRENTHSNGWFEWNSNNWFKVFFFSTKTWTIASAGPTWGSVVPRRVCVSVSVLSDRSQSKSTPWEYSISFEYSFYQREK